jgi:hypothetical protein
MCCYCDNRTDAEIGRDIAAVAVPDEVFCCDRGWAETARVWGGYSHADDDVEDWIGLCRRRAKVLASLAIASMHSRQQHDNRRIGRH